MSSRRISKPTLMPRVKYEEWKPQAEALEIIEQANAICRRYTLQGYDLTLRQLYYQFVARDLIPNNIHSYNKLGAVINRARMAGLLDWSYIVDRTRHLSGTSHWLSPESAIKSAAKRFAQDKWRDQPYRVEVWVEKEALAGVIARVAIRNDVDFFSCRGYVSQSEMWGAAQRIRRYIEQGQPVVVLHLGDHDPSGIDMTRDMTDRMHTFIDQDFLNAHPEKFPNGKATVKDIRKAMGALCSGHTSFRIKRIALNMKQVQQYQPPPNPAKLTDSRVGKYIERFGRQSWELDALEPQVLDTLIEENILKYRDNTKWVAAKKKETQHRETMVKVAGQWKDIVKNLENPPKPAA